MNSLYREASETESRNLPAVCKGGGNGLSYNIAFSRLTGHSERSEESRCMPLVSHKPVNTSRREVRPMTLHPPAALSFRAEVQAGMNSFYSEASEREPRNLPALR